MLPGDLVRNGAGLMEEEHLPWSPFVPIQGGPHHVSTAGIHERSAWRRHSLKSPMRRRTDVHGRPGDWRGTSTRRDVLHQTWAQARALEGMDISYGGGGGGVSGQSYDWDRQTSVPGVLTIPVPREPMLSATAGFMADLQRANIAGGQSSYLHAPLDFRSMDALPAPSAPAYAMTAGPWDGSGVSNSSAHAARVDSFGPTLGRHARPSESPYLLPSSRSMDTFAPVVRRESPGLTYGTNLAPADAIRVASARRNSSGYTSLSGSLPLGCMVPPPATVTPTEMVSYPHKHGDQHPEFLQSLIRAGNVSRSTVVLSNIYRTRLARVFACLHCLSLVCLLLAHKFTQDVPYKNLKWAAWAKVPIQWLNALELAALLALNFNVNVDKEEFDNAAIQYLRTIPLSQSPIISSSPVATRLSRTGAALTPIMGFHRPPPVVAYGPSGAVQITHPRVMTLQSTPTGSPVPIATDASVLSPRSLNRTRPSPFPGVTQLAQLRVSRRNNAYTMGATSHSQAATGGQYLQPRVVEHHVGLESMSLCDLSELRITDQRELGLKAAPAVEPLASYHEAFMQPLQSASQFHSYQMRDGNTTITPSQYMDVAPEWEAERVDSCSQSG